VQLKRRTSEKKRDQEKTESGHSTDQHGTTGPDFKGQATQDSWEREKIGAIRSDGRGLQEEAKETGAAHCEEKAENAQIKAEFCPGAL